MKFIVGKKMNMTQVWQGEDVIPVTKIQAGPCTVVQIKTKDKDGYEAVQVGYGNRNKKNIKKPQQGHTGELGNFSQMREFRVTPGDLKRGDKIDVSTFDSGDHIKVTSVSKGKGFQGVVRRHGFKGAKATHGTKDQLRMPGSIGATGPAHVFKGVRMPGRMGGDQVTVTNLEIIEIDQENNIIAVKGAVPGARNTLVLIQGEGELKVRSASSFASTHAKASADKKATENKKDEGIGAKEEVDKNETRGKQDLEIPEEKKVPDSGKNVKEKAIKKKEKDEEDIEEVVVEAAEKVSLNAQSDVEDPEKGSREAQKNDEGVKGAEK